MRERQFSDMSIAESCIDTYNHPQKTQFLLKRQPAQNHLSSECVYDVITHAQRSYSYIDLGNILHITKHLYDYCTQQLHMKDQNILKTVIVELLSHMIDKVYIGTEYTIVYRPVVKNTIPSYIDILHKNDNLNKSRKRFILFRKRSK